MKWIILPITVLLVGCTSIYPEFPVVNQSDFSNQTSPNKSSFIRKRPTEIIPVKKHNGVNKDEEQSIKIQEKVDKAVDILNELREKSLITPIVP